MRVRRVLAELGRAATLPRAGRSPRTPPAVAVRGGRTAGRSVAAAVDVNALSLPGQARAAPRSAAACCSTATTSHVTDTAMTLLAPAVVRRLVDGGCRAANSGGHPYTGRSGRTTMTLRIAGRPSVVRADRPVIVPASRAHRPSASPCRSGLLPSPPSRSRARPLSRTAAPLGRPGLLRRLPADRDELGFFVCRHLWAAFLLLPLVISGSGRVCRCSPPRAAAATASPATGRGRRAGHRSGYRASMSSSRPRARPGGAGQHLPPRRRASAGAARSGATCSTTADARRCEPPPSSTASAT